MYLMLNGSIKRAVSVNKNKPNILSESVEKLNLEMEIFKV